MKEERLKKNREMGVLTGAVAQRLSDRGRLCKKWFSPEMKNTVRNKSKVVRKNHLNKRKHRGDSL